MGATTLTRFLHGFRREMVGCDQKQHGTSFGDIEFEFLDDDDNSEMSSLANSSSSGECHPNETMELDEDDCERVEFNDVSNGDNRSFWDNQNKLLQASLCRTSSVESRIRNASKEAIEDIKSTETVCSCSRQLVATTSCRSCFMIEVSRRLQNAGFDTAICKTKWRTSLNIPSGEHTFVDVIDTTSSKKGNVIRVIIELNFRAEFEMAKASEDYNRLIRRLPEVFVGKEERLSNLIKILCMAAKRCMKENKMHMGPWRKYRYMQAKWLGPHERTTSATSLSMGFSERVPIPKPKPKASMLTVDLLDKLPNMQYKGFEVVYM